MAVIITHIAHSQPSLPRMDDILLPACSGEKLLKVVLLKRNQNITSMPPVIIKYVAIMPLKLMTGVIFLHMVNLFNAFKKSINGKKLFGR